jgi:hypothetical protein
MVQLTLDCLFYQLKSKESGLISMLKSSSITSRSVHLLFGIALLIVSLGYGGIIQPNYGAVENLHLFENCISWDVAACIR